MAAEDSGVNARVENRDGTRHRPPLETGAGGDDAGGELAADLRAAVDGDVRFDEYTRVLYATDGSIYGAQPAGVVFPRDTADVRAAMTVAADHDVPVLPRGAGSSLAGQTVGPGCVVLDLLRHMDEIREIEPDGRTAVVQPGVVQDDLDDALEPHGLRFAPDPASSNRATIGGGIGNNSTGAHSVRYGITDAYVEECRVVLADGSLIRTRDVVLDSPEWERLVSKDDREAAIYRTVRALVEDNVDEIEERYPDLKRSVSGYNLQKVIREDAESEAARAASEDRAGKAREEGNRVLNLSKLLVGAEGTLGVVVEATLSLVTRPDETALAVYCYDDLLEALAAVPEALELEASAVELMDDEVFRLAAESAEYAEYVEPIPEGTAAALLLEFDSEVVDDLPAAVETATADLVGGGAAVDSITAFEPAAQDRLWKLRKAAIPLLMSMDGDPKPYPFVEDASVPPGELAEYVAGFQEILEDHDTEAAYFAHAGVGTLHIRPVLNLKEGEDVEKMRAIADDVTDLVREHNGSFSGEHGDGLARTEFNPKLYGPDLWAAFQDLKSAFDPDWRMNPGKVVYRDDDPTDSRENLRYGPDYASLEPRTTLEFDDEGGFSELVELCNGCGTCRQTDGDVMCPTYRATEEEIATTRGRANLLRAAISGEIDPEELYSERFQSDVLDLCVGCKGCQSDCPTGVDLAKLKAEVKHGYHEREGVSLRERLFANVDRLASLGSTFAPVTNHATDLPGARTVLEKTIGIAPERTLPTFRRESLVEWFEQRDVDAVSETRAGAPRARGGTRVAPEDATAGVVLFPDTDTNYSNPEVGKAAVEVLEAADVRVAIPDLGPTGRAAYSEGLLETAAEQGRELLDDLEPSLERGWSVLFVEPSDAAMVVDEYRSLLADGRVERLAANAYGVCEYVDERRLDEVIAFDESVTAGTPVTFHGHCHQKARGADHHAVGVLRRAGYAVEPVDSTCCGMAGSFGYEVEHYDLSKAMGSLLREQLEASSAESSGNDSETIVAAPGTSCRTQVGDLEGYDRPAHPVELLARGLESE
ncbi:D-lactate dehydrogenase (cytochrome) [Natrinema pellirubrum DSM 15624]|uniref:D-lactate dehydrogenase (Cytochrome) n=1 Tax=Natrinema pellirubrum (strain DSM 15624 / CIP 106293 / JCM 10476 / NCIMB 786 / 157) TaxID=797303 RepID=L0JL79_NATP1|nr:FAD-binding and (Fe-S)-binding domain-containing protein [Natrinema pellirubrum]AGB31608.1 FAD/FMN-dependent dehydrogenase [Natrinema pellirubrum DSM 15624]ELY73178.1 D-lactate dehydrogenase (cytochrome) [Natrinema pellirubrum DSM 15624]